MSSPRSRFPRIDLQDAGVAVQLLADGSCLAAGEYEAVTCLGQGIGPVEVVGIAVVSLPHLVSFSVDLQEVHIRGGGCVEVGGGAVGIAGGDVSPLATSNHCIGLVVLRPAVCLLPDLVSSGVYPYQVYVLLPSTKGIGVADDDVSTVICACQAVCHIFPFPSIRPIPDQERVVGLEAGPRLPREPIL